MTTGKAAEKPHLTDTQQDVLRGLIALTRAKGYPPSLAELADKVGLNSPSTVKYQLETLAKLGYVERVPRQPRAIRVLMTPPRRNARNRRVVASTR